MQQLFCIQIVFVFLTFLLVFLFIFIPAYYFFKYYSVFICIPYLYEFL